MSDARWVEIYDDMRSAKRHFGRSAELFEEGGFEGDDLAAYKSQMAVLHAMESGHTALEGGLERILELLGEEKPTGGNYHADLIRRLSRAIEGGRPALLNGALAEAADETRRFRHVARKAYDGFDTGKAASAIAAARVVADEILQAIDSFRAIVDPR